LKRFWKDEQTWTIWVMLEKFDLEGWFREPQVEPDDQAECSLF
jgi:hypothetical protein